jgi:hypothetical protein
MTTKKLKTKTLRKNRKSRRGGSTLPMGSNPVFKPTQGQFGYSNPNKVDLTGNFTEYSIGFPGFGFRGYTQPGANIGTMQHMGVTGLPQNIGIAAGLLIPGAATTMAGIPATSTFDPAKAPPNYYNALGIVRSETPLDNRVLQTAYNSKKNIGTNAQKQLVKNAYNTLSDPAKRYQYDAMVNQYFTAHPPSVAQLLQMSSQPTNPNQQKFNPETAFKMLSFLPGFSSALQAPIRNGR